MQILKISKNLLSSIQSTPTKKQSQQTRPSASAFRKILLTIENSKKVELELEWVEMEESMATWHSHDDSERQNNVQIHGKQE